jgi:hypothetical protein
LVGAFLEFAAGVEVGEDEFEGGDFLLGVHGDGDAAPVVFDGDGAVEVDFEFDGGGVTGEGFVNGVVHDFIDAVVEAGLVGVADIHSGAFADGFEAFEALDVGGFVGGVSGVFLGGCGGRGGRGVGGVGHGVVVMRLCALVRFFEFVRR